MGILESLRLETEALWEYMGGTKVAVSHLFKYQINESGNLTSQG